MSPTASSGDRPPSRAVLAPCLGTRSDRVPSEYAYGARRYVRPDLTGADRNLLARS